MNDKVTLAGAVGKVVTYIDATGEHTVKPSSGDYTLSADGKTITLSDAYLDENFNAENYGKLIQTIDASAVVHELKITGNSLANKITGTGEDDVISGGSGSDTLSGGKGNDSLAGGKGDDLLYGNAGDDTLWGGAGNDSLYGGDGDDVFIYKPGEGTDRIFGYESGELIQIIKADGSEGTFTKSTYNSYGNLVLTISGGGSIIVRDVEITDTFNINGTSYTVSNGKLK